jgi:hypothetical protein
MMRAVVFTLLLIGASADSIKSCGKAGDILQNAVFSSSPNPISKDAPLTITGSGTLSAPFTGGKFDIDLQVKALGIINEPVKIISPFTFAPGIAAGATKVVVGPFSLPKLPGSADITGTIIANDPSGKEIFCIELDIVAGGDIANAALVDESHLVSTSRATADPITDCSASSDHLHDRVVSSTGGKTTLSGDLDESLSSITTAVDLKIGVSIFHIPISLDIPISISPAIAKGHLEATFGPKETETSTSAIKYSIEGTVKINDANKSEVVCINVDKPKFESGNLEHLIDVQ